MCVCMYGGVNIEASGDLFEGDDKNFHRRFDGTVAAQRPLQKKTMTMSGMPQEYCSKWECAHCLARTVKKNE